MASGGGGGHGTVATTTCGGPRKAEVEEEEEEEVRPEGRLSGATTRSNTWSLLVTRTVASYSGCHAVRSYPGQHSMDICAHICRVMISHVTFCEHKNSGAEVFPCRLSLQMLFSHSYPHNPIFLRRKTRTHSAACAWFFRKDLRTNE